MLTCPLAAGWHYLPNFKDVAAEVPLPNFIFAGEVKTILMGRGDRKLVSAQLPFSCPFCSIMLLPVNSPQHHTAPQLNPCQQASPACCCQATLQAAKQPTAPGLQGRHMME